MSHNRCFAKVICFALLTLGVAARVCGEPTGAAAQLVAHFRMEKIPDEGAWFAASYRSDDKLLSQALDRRYQGTAHVAGSAIHALVTHDDFSALHKLQTDEIWHYYSGSALELLLLHPDGRGEKVILGPDVLAGQRPQVVVPRGVWQGASPVASGRDAYTLFGCTLAPSFEYGDFVIGYRDELQQAYPAFSSRIAQLTRSEFAKKPVGTKAAALSAEDPIVSTIFSSNEVAVIDVAPGTKLRELIGRNAKFKTANYSVALFTLAPGTAMPTSYNRVAEEVFLITAGQGEVTIDQKAHKVASGSTIVIAPEIRHSIRASAGAPLSFYAISLPAFSPDDYVLTPAR